MAPEVRKHMVSGPLANVSMAYRNPHYIADRVFPLVDRCGPKAKILIFKKGAWFRDEAAIIARSARAPRGGHPTDEIPIALKKYGFASEVPVDDIEDAKKMGGSVLEPATDAIEFATNKVDLAKERRIASVVLNGTWSGVAGEDAEGLWAAGAGNTFINDVETRIETIRKNTGFRPNVLLLAANILPQLKMESTLLDRIKYTQKGVLTANLIASMFELEEVLIGDSIYSTADEAKDGDDFNSMDIWEKNEGKGSAFLYYRPAKPSRKIPMAGLQARGVMANGQARRTRTWYEDAEDQHVYEVTEETHILQTGGDLRFRWDDCIAT